MEENSIPQSFSVATIEARVEADIAEEKVELYAPQQDNPAYEDLKCAAATIRKCADRMATCKPQSRFAYAAQITKARSRLAQAENRLGLIGWARLR